MLCVLLLLLLLFFASLINGELTGGRYVSNKVITTCLPRTICQNMRNSENIDLIVLGIMR